MLAKITTTAAAIALIAFNACAVIAQFSAFSLTQDEQRYEDAIANLTQLEKLMVDAETGQRGYTITNEQDFLEPYQQAKKVIPSYLVKIRAIPEYAQINQLVASKLAQAAYVIRLNQSQRERVTSTRKGKQIMDRLRKAIAAAIQSQQAQKSVAARNYSVAKNGALLLLASAFSADIAAVVFVRWRARDVRSQAKELKIAVEQKTRELVAANHQLQEAYHLKSQFLATVSHEYRNPLTKILLVVDLLRSQPHAPWTKKATWFSQIETAVRKMTQLLDQVLTLENQPQPQRVQLNLHKLIETIVEEQPEWERVRFMSHASNIVGKFDENSLREAIGNLLSNALKYSTEVVVMRLMLIGSTAVIEVRDRGIGIPQQDIPRLFQDFSRGSNAGAIQGTGLGLAIAHRAVMRCGGTISVSSKEGAGSTFRIELPLE